MTQNTIEPMDLVSWHYYTGCPKAVYIFMEFALKNGKKLDVESEKPIVEYIWKVLPNDKLYECQISSGRLHFLFKPMCVGSLIKLLFQHKIIDDLTLQNCKKIYEEEWEKCQANFKNYIIKNIINQ